MAASARDQSGGLIEPSTALRAAGRTRFGRRADDDDLPSSGFSQANAPATRPQQMERKRSLAPPLPSVRYGGSDLFKQSRVAAQLEPTTLSFAADTRLIDCAND